MIHLKTKNTGYKELGEQLIQSIHSSKIIKITVYIGFLNGFDLYIGRIIIMIQAHNRWKNTIFGAPLVLKVLSSLSPTSNLGPLKSITSMHTPRLIIHRIFCTNMEDSMRLESIWHLGIYLVNVSEGNEMPRATYRFTVPK